MSVFPTKVLLATDASEESSQAGEVAAELAEKTDSELHVVYVGPTTPVVGASSGSDFESTERDAEDILGRRTQEIEAAGGTVSKLHVRKGDVAKNILALEAEIVAGVIVAGSRGLGGVKRAFSGSVSDTLVREARCPVMVVREED